jgi:hypothetical protein
VRKIDAITLRAQIRLEPQRAGTMPVNPRA